jgi:hypothetical protein
MKGIVSTFNRHVFDRWEYKRVVMSRLITSTKAPRKTERIQNTQLTLFTREHSVDFMEHSIDFMEHSIDFMEHSVDFREHSVAFREHSVDFREHISPVGSVLLSLCACQTSQNRCCELDECLCTRTRSQIRVFRKTHYKKWACCGLFWVILRVT